MENMKPIDSAVVEPEAKQTLTSTEEESHDIIAPPQFLKAKNLIDAGLMGTSDEEGFKQLLFHITCAVLCAVASKCWYEQGRWVLFALVQIPFAIVSSFYFNGFHEMVHNTAFRTQALNTFFAQILGFFTFRGAMWFWCFHWTHHRYTNDATKDPELSGGSLDLDDPTCSLKGYMSFLSGYPFGFERIVGMAEMAIGKRVDPWVATKNEKTQKMVRVEAFLYLLGYFSLVVAAVYNPELRRVFVLYWLLPHCLGAGHLRLYQFAEHRACKMGVYTETNAWIASRTTISWPLYVKLAWYMPFHVEHHAWPNCPFHKLRDVHERVKAAYEKEGKMTVPTGCNPEGKDGYVALHKIIFRKMLGNVFGDDYKASPAASVVSKFAPSLS